MNPQKQAIADIVAKCLPNADRLIVVPEEKEKITKTGIARSQVKKGEDETQIGTVIAVGPGYSTEYGQFIATRSKPGDRVLLDKFAGISVRITKDGKVLPQHEDVTEDRLPIRIVRQDAILWTFPSDFPV